MATTFEEFPHHGDHLETDHEQAVLTLWLLAAFVFFVTFLGFLATLG